MFRRWYAAEIESVTEAGLAYAVWGLLEDHCGVVCADPTWEHIPQRPLLSVGPLDETVELTLGDGEHDLLFTLDRGDGLEVRLTTPARGWKDVTATPDAKRQQFVITLGGRAQAMSTEARIIDDLPALRLVVVPRQ